MSVTADQVVTLLENTLFESPSSAMENAPGYSAMAAVDTVSDLASAMAAQPEAGIAEQILRYYFGMLGRAPNGAEVSFYVSVAEAGLSHEQIAQGVNAVSPATWSRIATCFAASPEFASIFGGMTTNANLVTAFYLNTLGRAPSAGEVGFYQTQLDHGTPVSTIALNFINSPEYQGKTALSASSGLASYGEQVVAGSAHPSFVPIQYFAPAHDRSVELIGLHGQNGAITF